MKPGNVVLLTGGNGMVGKNILYHPLAKNYEIVAPSSDELDLRDYQQTEAFMRELRPAAVVHAAGKVGGIQANIAEPVEFLLANLDMGRNIVAASRAAGVKQLLNLGSSCMYPRDAPNPLVEEAILTGQLEPTNEGYALAKVVTARLCQYVRRESPEYVYKTLIPCNVYGPYDKFSPEKSHLVPAIIHKLHAARVEGRNEVEIWGDGCARREFMYAADLAQVVLQALDSLNDIPELMNVGLGFDYSIREYYEAAAEVVGWYGRFTYDLSKPTGMKQKLISVSRLREWSSFPTTSLKYGLEQTYDYYLKEIAK